MDEHKDKKMKMSAEHKPQIKSLLLKRLPIEEQIKYQKLDKYLENLTFQEFNSICWYNQQNVIDCIELCDRILFMVFFKKMNKYNGVFLKYFS